MISECKRTKLFLQFCPVIQGVKTNSYSSRRICRLLNKPPSDWSADEEPFLTHLLGEHKSIRQVHQLSKHFRQLMNEKSAEGLAQWCEEAETVSAYTGFVRGLRQDYAAVEQAFVSAWSNGQTEGQVNRLKMLKRQGYGRAGFDRFAGAIAAPTGVIPKLHFSPKLNQNHFDRNTQLRPHYAKPLSAAALFYFLCNVSFTK